MRFYSSVLPGILHAVARGKAAPTTTQGMSHSRSKRDRDVFPKRFEDECFREMEKFLHDMSEKHDGISYDMLFQYNTVLQAVMITMFMELEEKVGETEEVRMLPHDVK
jgi:hypothetical protein